MNHAESVTVKLILLYILFKVVVYKSKIGDLLLFF